VNELITLAEGLDADVWEAIDAAATKPFGFQPFRPGPGVGGHCIPVDPQFLTWRAEDIGTEVSFIDDAHQINEQMPQFVVDRFETLLRARGVDIEDASIVALGAAYKPNVGDTRKSPALRVIEALPETTNVTVVDPHTDSENTARSLVESPETVDIESVDAVLLLVDHDAFDLDAIGERASFVFDTRNAMPEDVDATVVTLGSLLDEVQADDRVLHRAQMD
jgi:nucleotide sugar dehydrogenase